LCSADSQDELEWLPAECLIIDGDCNIDESSLCVYSCGQYAIKYHDVSAAIQRTACSMNSIAIAEENQSDLLPAKYEGNI